MEYDDDEDFDKDSAWLSYCESQQNSSGSPNSKRGPRDIEALFDLADRPPHEPDEWQERAFQRVPHKQFPAALLPSGVGWTRTGDFQVTFKVPRKHAHYTYGIDEFFGKYLSLDIVALPRKSSIPGTQYEFHKTEGGPLWIPN